MQLTGLGVALEAEHDFRGAVPSRGYIFCHVASILFGVDGEAASKTKIANLELTVGIHKEVTGLEISVEDIGGVDVLEAAEDLVNEGLEVGVGKRLARTDNGGQITFHQLCMSKLASVRLAGEVGVANLRRDMFR